MRRTRLPETLLAGVLGLVLLLAGSRTAAHAQTSEPSKDDSEAQRFTMMLRGVPLEQALEELTDVAQIDLAYDSHLVQDRQDAHIFCTAREVPAEAVLRCILRDAGLDFYQTSSGTYILTERTRQAPRYGRLAGVVVDRATGEPLPNANVLLADANVGTATNEAGLFSFSSLVSGPHRVVVTYVGYETSVDSIWVTPGGSARRRIALRTRSVAAKPAVVNGLQQRLPSGGLGQGELATARLAAPEGVGTADVARSAGSLMGVMMQEPMADLHIQGGAAGAHQMRLDGVPVRNPVALGRLLGAFSPLALERVTVQKAGFGAEHGSQLSGIISAEHTLADSTHQYATVQVDPLSLNGKAQGPLDLASLRGSAMAAVRTSLWNLYRDPTLDNLLQDWRGIDPLLTSNRLGQTVSPPSRSPGQRHAEVAFSDLHAAARLRPHPFHTLYASFYRGSNRVDAWSAAAEEQAPSSTSRADSLLARDRYHWTNWVGQVRHDWMLGARALGTFRLYGSRQSLGHGYRMAGGDAAAGRPSLQEGPYDGSQISEIGMEAELGYNVAARHDLSGALKAVRLASDAYIDGGFARALTYANTSWQLSGYLKDEVSLGLQTTLEAGLRLTYPVKRRTVYAEPRLSVRHDGSHPALGDYALRLAGGLYRQFVNRFDLSSAGPTAIAPSVRFWLPVDRSLAPPRSYHLAADALLKPTPAWKINLEAYYKEQPHLLALDYPALLEMDNGAPLSMTQARFIAPTHGRALGGGLRIRREGERVQGTLSYSFSRARRRVPGRFENRLEPPPWSQPHHLSLEGRVALTSGLSARLRWRGIWGRSWGFRRAYYAYLAPAASPGDYAPFDLSDPSMHTLPPLYRLDLGLSYTRTWGGLTVEARADLINVLDRRNAFDWNLRPVENGYAKAVRTMPGRRPVLSVRVGY